MILSGALARIINVLIWSVVTEYGRASTAVSAPASRIIGFIFIVDVLVAASHDAGWDLYEAASRGAVVENGVGQWITVSRLSVCEV